MLRRDREVYFKGEENMLLRVVDSIFASGYLTAGGQGHQGYPFRPLKLQALPTKSNPIDFLYYPYQHYPSITKEDRHDSGKIQTSRSTHYLSMVTTAFMAAVTCIGSTLHSHWTGADFSHEPRHLSVPLSAATGNGHHQLLSLSADRISGRSSCLLWIS